MRMADPPENASNQTEDYFYEYPDNFTPEVLMEMIPVALVYGCMFLLGVVGNSLVVVSIAKHTRMQTVTNAFLASLASADLLLVLICIPVKFAKFFTFTWTFGEALCKGIHYIQNASVICSILTMTSMSVERVYLSALRNSVHFHDIAGPFSQIQLFKTFNPDGAVHMQYYAIVYPMRAKFRCHSRRARNVICLVWIASFILAIPILFGQIHREVGLQKTAYWCVKEWPTKTYSIAYELLYAHVVFVMPLCVMVFTYIHICRELWSVSAWRASLHTARSYPMSTLSSDRSVSPISLKRSCSRVRDNSEGMLCPQHRVSVNFQNSRRAVVSYDDQSKRKQVIRMLLIIIVLFVICWGPTLVDNILKAFHVISELNEGVLKPMRVAFAIMAYSNSCINPIIYAFMSKNFRKCFKQAICLPCGRERSSETARRNRALMKGTAMLIEDDCQLTDVKYKTKSSVTGGVTRMTSSYEKVKESLRGKVSAVGYSTSAVENGV